MKTTQAEKEAALVMVPERSKFRQFVFLVGAIIILASLATGITVACIGIPESLRHDHEIETAYASAKVVKPKIPSVPVVAPRHIRQHEPEKVAQAAYLAYALSKVESAMTPPAKTPAKKTRVDKAQLWRRIEQPLSRVAEPKKSKSGGLR